MRIFFCFVLAGLVFSTPILCGGTNHIDATSDLSSRVQDDPFYFDLPKYRIDHSIKRVVILGKREGNQQIVARIAKLFTGAGIEVVEPENFDSFLKGKVIEYDRGLSSEDAQVITSLLQVDHIIFFEEENTTHNSYRYGGKNSTSARLKVIKTTDGQVIYETSRTWGRFLPDPRPYFGQISKEPHERTSGPCWDLLNQELVYAIGKVAIGIFMRSDLSVTGVFSGSPADKAGIVIDDRILKIDDVETNRLFDIDNLVAKSKQGDTQVFTIERQGKILQLNIQYPIVPMMNNEEQISRPPFTNASDLSYSLPQTGGVENDKDGKAPLIIKDIQFHSEKGMKEKVLVISNRFIDPSVMALEGEKPRLVIDIRNTNSVKKGLTVIPVKGRFIQQIRSHLHAKTGTFRVVLDLNPGEQYRVSQAYLEAENMYVVEVEPESKR